MESDLVKRLRDTNNLSNSMLARSIEKTDSYYSRKDIKNRKKAYKLFLKLIDPKTSERLTELDTEIDLITDVIYDETGWWRTSDGFMYEDNFKNMHDPEFRSFDTFRVYRNEDGYYINTGEPYNSYFAYIQDKEYRFFEKYKSSLGALHEALTEKEQIMYGKYQVQDKSNKELCAQIALYLGYKKEEKDNKKNK